MIRHLSLFATLAVFSLQAHAIISQPNCAVGTAIRGVWPTPNQPARFTFRVISRKPSEPSLLVRVFDPYLLFPLESQSPLVPVSRHTTTEGHLQQLRRHLTVKKTGVRVWLDHWQTYWDYVPEEPNTLDIVFGGVTLSEPPDLAVAGILFQVAFDELKVRFAQSWQTLIAEQVAELRADGFSEWDESLLRLEIEEVFRLRSTWHLKFNYYNSCPFRPRWSEPFFDRLNRESEERGTSVVDGEMLTEFRGFYQLDPRLVSRIWRVPLPPRWELALAAPE